MGSIIRNLKELFYKFINPKGAEEDLQSIAKSAGLNQNQIQDLMMTSNGVKNWSFDDGETSKNEETEKKAPKSTTPKRNSIKPIKPEEYVEKRKNKEIISTVESIERDDR